MNNYLIHTIIHEISWVIGVLQGFEAKAPAQESALLEQCYERLGMIRLDMTKEYERTKDVKPDEEPKLDIIKFNGDGTETVRMPDIEKQFFIPQDVYNEFVKDSYQ